MSSIGRSNLWWDWRNFTGHTCSSMACMYICFILDFNFHYLVVIISINWLFPIYRFDDKNTVKLLTAARDDSSVETDIFYFDSKCIDWDDYFMNTHIPGIVKYVFKWKPKVIQNWQWHLRMFRWPLSKCIPSIIIYTFFFL